MEPFETFTITQGDAIMTPFGIKKATAQTPAGFEYLVIRK